MDRPLLGHQPLYVFNLSFGYFIGVLIPRPPNTKIYLMPEFLGGQLVGAKLVFSKKCGNHTFHVKRTVWVTQKRVEKTACATHWWIFHQIKVSHPTKRRFP
jgi:hypothetical protein